MKNSKQIIQCAALCITLLWLCNAHAQGGYKISFEGGSTETGMRYMGQHFRDTFIITDSAMMDAGKVTFSGKAKLDKGLYTLLDNKKKKVFDFMIDDSRTFSVKYDERHTNGGMRVKGSKANSLMFSYMAEQDKANAEAKKINEKRKDPTQKAELPHPLLGQHRPHRP